MKRSIPRPSLHWETKVQPIAPTRLHLRDGSPGEGWKNRLLRGDNLGVMGALREELAGQVHLVYIDPPFATGSEFRFSVPLGESGTVHDALAYADAHGGPCGFLSMMVPRLRAIRDLLHPEGSLILHCDYRTSHYLGVVLDEVMGPGDRSGTPNQPGFRNEIVWSLGAR